MRKEVIESGFLRDVQSAFADSLQSGELKLEASLYDEKCFGNAQVILSDIDFKLRITCDRGDIFADVLPTALGKWWPFERALKAVAVVDGPSEGVRSLEEIAHLYKNYRRQLQRGLGPQQVSETAQKLAQLTAKKQ